ncbi:MAG: septal ring lytic transglycosylase RlpA family protein [Sulfuriferula sp.]
MKKILALLIITSLAGCASAPKRQLPAEPSSTIANTHVKKPGGYYMDDGPGDNPPADIDAIPDATPKIEPLHKYANRPYAVLGETYTPATENCTYQAQGIASWYGKKFNGKRTASGEIYDMYGMSAAHLTLPIPSYARVKSLTTGKSVIVRINDRGPFHSKRIIDLSYTAAHKLGIAQGGSGMVEVTAITPAEISEGRDVASNTAGIFLQLGSFTSRDNAEKLLARASTQLSKSNAALVIFTKQDRYRVALGPYEDNDSAKIAAQEIESRMNLKPVRSVIE